MKTRKPGAPRGTQNAKIGLTTKTEYFGTRCTMAQKRRFLTLRDEMNRESRETRKALK